MPRKSRKSQDQQRVPQPGQQQPDMREEEKQQEQAPDVPGLNPGRAPDVSRNPGAA